MSWGFKNSSCRLAKVSVIAVLFCASFVSAEEPRPLLLDVLDRKTEAQYNGLNADNFIVKINGKPASIQSAKRIQLKSHVSILLDTSGSMAQKEKWNTAIDLAKATVRAIPKSVDVSLTAFSDHATPARTVVGVEEVLNALTMQSSNLRIRSSTSLWDAIGAAISSGNLRLGDAIVTITDGGDNDSRMTERDVEKLVLQSGVRVFTVWLPEDDNWGSRELNRLVQNSGGAFLNIGKVKPNLRVGKESHEYAIDPNEKENIPRYAAYIVPLLLRPYLVMLNAPASSSGKIKVEISPAMKEKN
jgi:von Willebrand factor type A domain